MDLSQGGNALLYETNYLMHHGIKGQKWGVRRFQNEDGSLTAEGKKRYGESVIGSAFRKAAKATGQAAAKILKKAKDKVAEKIDDKLDDMNPSRMSDQELRDKLNRLNMEKQYKQVLKELHAKPKKEHKFAKSVGDTLGKVLMATATTTMSEIAKRSLQTKSDEILAPKRMARALKDGKTDIYDRKNLKDFTYFKPKISKDNNNNG